MDEAQKAWRVWYLMQELSDALWRSYENEFLEIDAEGHECGQIPPAPVNRELPF